MPKDALLPLAQLLPPHDAMRFDMNDERLDELTDSIRHDGVLMPLLVIQVPSPTTEKSADAEPGTGGLASPVPVQYEVRAGHRRLVSCQRLCYQPVPCRIFERGEPGYDGLMATENLIREECTPFEEGVLFATIADIPGITEEEMRRKCGHKSLAYIYDRIALVKGDEDIAIAVHKGLISFGVAKKLNQVRYPAPGQHGEKFEGDKLQNAIASADCYRKSFLERCIAQGATVAVAESFVAQWRQTAGVIVQSTQPAIEPMPPGGYPLPQLTCALCGESDAPEKFETISVHRNELAAFRAALAAQGGGQ